jgi:outer membrane protein assembly factor BamB
MGNPVEAGGSIGRTLEWRLMKSRTLEVRRVGGGSWTTSILGRLTRSPAVLGTVMAIVDDGGTVYGCRLDTGEEIWRRSLGASPAQAPLASRLGFLVSATDGSAQAIEPEDGKVRRLQQARPGRTLALPWGDGALLIGGGESGLRKIGPTGAAVPLGTAEPHPSGVYVVTEGAVAWRQEDGVRLLFADGSAPVAASGLGPAPLGLAAGPGTIYSVDAGGTVRAVALSAPQTTLWAVPLGAAPGSALVSAGNALFILVNGGVVAIER